MLVLNSFVRTGVAAVVATLAMVAVASPASASVSQGYVVGAGAINNDFGDEGPLSTGVNNHNLAVGLWQHILWADGYLGGGSQLDCQFGPQTRSATIAWQRDHGLAADGIVGSGTFGKADNYLYRDDYDGTIAYDGSVRDIYGMYRSTNSGRYVLGGHHVSYTATGAGVCQ
ncbi:peptidoglycan-binding domain-containing protein [Nocardiopsis sinuspersici]|nr:peptidoglycan-binding domain-containing protein [Nocardiopsis sinuspersici]